MRIRFVYPILFYQLPWIGIKVCTIKSSLMSKDPSLNAAEYLDYDRQGPMTPLMIECVASMPKGM